MQAIKSNTKKIMSVGVLSSILALTACQTVDSHTHSNDERHMGDGYHHNSTHHNGKHQNDTHHLKMQHGMMADAKADGYKQAYMQGMRKMRNDMMAGMQSNNADVAFAKGMLPHHEGAVDMAKVQLKYGKNSTMRQLAKDIIDAQQAEIKQMSNWIASHPDTDEQSYTKAMQQDYQSSMKSMHSDMMQGINSDDPDMAFAKGMLPHHQGAVAMAEVQLKYGKNSEMRKLAQNIIDAQQSEIKLMQNWIADHS